MCSVGGPTGAPVPQLGSGGSASSRCAGRRCRHAESRVESASFVAARFAPRRECDYPHVRSRAWTRGRLAIPNESRGSPRRLRQVVARERALRADRQMSREQRPVFLRLHDSPPADRTCGGEPDPCRNDARAVPQPYAAERAQAVIRVLSNELTRETERRLSGTWKKDRTCSWTKSSSLHVSSRSRNGSGSNGGQQPVGCTAASLGTGACVAARAFDGKRLGHLYFGVHHFSCLREGLREEPTSSYSPRRADWVQSWPGILRSFGE